jgi:hypothetical protein
MDTILEYADLSLLTVSIAILVVMWRKRLISDNRALAGYLAAVLAMLAVEIPILFFRKTLGIRPSLAYPILFFSTQILSVMQSALILAVIYNVFNTAMRPLKGLQRMGKLVFKWVAVVSILLAAVIAMGPHVFASGSPSYTIWVTTVIGRAQEGINVLTICLLLFVCIATKPLGLTFRSHVFGIALGLGIISTTELVQATWFWTTNAHSLYSPIYMVSAIGYVIAFSTWGAYFAIPEPARKLILLPTTSPFFHWNRISEALGDAPGNVAIGFNASMISSVETKVMTAMSKGARARAELAKAEAEAEANTLVAS